MLFSLTNPEIAILMMVIFLFAVLLGFPIAFTLMAMGVGFGYYAYFDPTRMEHLLDNRIFQLFVQNTYTVMDNTVLTAVPLFLFMGYLVERAGIVSRVFFAIRLACHGLPASMAVAALITCALFSTATGIIGAVVTLMGLLAWPAMIKAGYDKKFASGVICSGGCLGILIPPSLPMIVYGFITEESVIALFLAGIGPGIFLISLFIIYSIIYSKFFGGFKKLEPSTWAVKKNTSEKVIPTIILAFLILGGIYTGVFTPTEAAAVGFFLSLIITVFILKTLTWEEMLL